MEKINELITRLESRIKDHEIIKPGISKVTVGWHIEHTLLTMDIIIDALWKSDPHEYKRTYDIRRNVVILKLLSVSAGKHEMPVEMIFKRESTAFSHATIQARLHAYMLYRYYVPAGTFFYTLYYLPVYRPSGLAWKN